MSRCDAAQPVMRDPKRFQHFDPAWNHGRLSFRFQSGTRGQAQVAACAGDDDQVILFQDRVFSTSHFVSISVIICQLVVFMPVPRTRPRLWHCRSLPHMRDHPYLPPRDGSSHKRTRRCGCFFDIDVFGCGRARRYERASGRAFVRRRRLLASRRFRSA